MSDMSSSRMASGQVWIYVGAVVVLVVLAAVGLLTYTQQQATDEANAKAQQLSRVLITQGFHPVDVHNTALVLGTGGGAVCKDPNSALKRGLWRIQLANGAGGPGLRPIVADRRSLEAGAAVINVYCPDRLAQYQERISALKTAELVR